jgi:hypothetical protein
VRAPDRPQGPRRIASNGLLRAEAIHERWDPALILAEDLQVRVIGDRDRSRRSRSAISVEEEVRSTESHGRGRGGGCDSHEVCGGEGARDHQRGTAMRASAHRPRAQDHPGAVGLRTGPSG